MLSRLAVLTAAVLLPAACEDAAAPVVEPAAPAPTADVRRLKEVADRLAAEYESGARPSPPSARDPRASLSPETLQMMAATAERLARTHHAADGD